MKKRLGNGFLASAIDCPRLGGVNVMCNETVIVTGQVNLTLLKRFGIHTVSTEHPSGWSVLLVILCIRIVSVSVWSGYPVFIVFILFITCAKCQFSNIATVMNTPLVPLGGSPIPLFLFRPYS